jgi:hypothetical protein
VLFLAPGVDGTFEPTDLGLATFREVLDGPRPLLVRDLASATEVVSSLDSASVERLAERDRMHLPRDPERFADWLEDRAADVVRPADYFVAGRSGLRRAAEPFTLTLSGPSCGANGGLPLRWREFDDNVSVRVLASDAAQPGVGDPIGGIQRSIAAWNNDNQSEVELLFGGTTTVSSRNDDRNTVLFEDPFDNISGSFSGSRGTLATAFVFFFCGGAFEFDGGQALEIVEADIVTQDGSGDNYFARRSQAAYDEVIGHEFGHFIGLGHSCGDDESPACSSSAVFDDALMRAQVHDDERGAQLETDDRNAVRKLYPAPVRNTPNAPKAPTGLTATALSTSEIQLTWTDASGNENAFLVEERSAFGGFVEIQSLPANTTALIVTGIPAGTFRAYRVRARNAGGVSAYTNEASATTRVAQGACAPGEDTLCLNGGRFRVTLTFEDFEGAIGPGNAEPLTDDTGYFTFFDPANVEVVVKVLNACPLVERYWVFAGGLTNVQVTLTVSDTTTGDTRTYLNELGTAFQPVQDTGAFATCP